MVIPHPVKNKSLRIYRKNKLLYGLSFCKTVAKNLFFNKINCWYYFDHIFCCCALIVASIFPCVIPENKFEVENLLSQKQATFFQHMSFPYKSMQIVCITSSVAVMTSSVVVMTSSVAMVILEL